MRAQRLIALAPVIFGVFYSVVGSAQMVYPPMKSGDQIPLIQTATETEELFVRRGVLFNDPELQEIVDHVGESIFPSAQDDYINYRIYLIRDPSPLMFSLADGQIYVHTGLLARLDDEAQLAAVLAHEAHHVAAHHHILADASRRKKANVAGGIAMALNQRESGQSFPDQYGGGSGTTYSSEMGHMTRSEFTEEMEVNADAASIGLIARAGHAPTAALQALASIREDPELSTDNPLGSFTTLDSLALREGKLRELVDGLPVQAANATVAARIRPQLLRRVIEMTIDDYIRLDRPGTALELIEKMIREQPDAFLYAAKGDSHRALGPRPVHELPETLAWYTNGKRHVKTRNEVFEKYMKTEDGPVRLAHNLESAMQAYNTSIELDEISARAYEGLGDLYFDQGDYRQSGRNYLKYLKLSPDSMDRPLVVEKLQHIKMELNKQKESEQ